MTTEEKMKSIENKLGDLYGRNIGNYEVISWLVSRVRQLEKAGQEIVNALNGPDQQYPEDQHVSLGLAAMNMREALIDDPEGKDSK